MKGINVVSAFDGMGCLYIALKEAGIEVNKYFAIEVDKFAIQQTNHNVPNIIHLGDIKNVSIKDFEGITIHLFGGGSPCQGFSFAGAGLNFDDPRSALFFEYVRILKELRESNLDIKFMLENVNMKRKHLGVINKYLEIFPVRINSKKVSAQNRDRFYWTNIKTKKVGLFQKLWSDIPQPKDRGILLKHIIEQGIPLKQKSKNILNIIYKESSDLIKEFNTSPSKRGMGGWVYNINGKSPTVTTNKGEGFKIGFGNGFYRKATVLECSRLQTIPDWYKWIVSNSQAYKMLGNGWTVEVIKHIFKYL